MAPITVKNLGKSYRSYRGKWGRIASWLGFKQGVLSEKQVLQDISFQLSAGESLGIVGMNGAGKSTLLKMITGTTRATTGTVSISGSVAALLELGIGFHPDLSGRENVFLSGSLMGFSRETLLQLMPEIEAFAEIGSYIDAPIRVYSSGMQVRLAFSVATAVRPDLLIVDEALSVGDAYFQHKCFDRIRAFSDLGTSLLFVSHDAAAVKNLCNRALLLNRGKMEYLGSPEEALDLYNALLSGSGTAGVALPAPELLEQGTRSGNGKLKIEAVTVFCNSKQSRIVTAGDPIDIVVSLRVHQLVPPFCIGIAIRDRFGNALLGTNTRLLKHPLVAAEIGQKIEARFHIPSLNIGEGHYSIAVAAHDPQSHVVSNYDWWDKAAIFEVVHPADAMVEGLCYMPVEFSIID